MSLSTPLLFLGRVLGVAARDGGAAMEEQLGEVRRRDADERGDALESGASERGK